MFIPKDLVKIVKLNTTHLKGSKNIIVFLTGYFSINKKKNTTA